MLNISLCNLLLLMPSALFCCGCACNVRCVHTVGLIDLAPMAGRACSARRGHLRQHTAGSGHESACLASHELGRSIADGLCASLGAAVAQQGQASALQAVYGIRRMWCSSTALPCPGSRNIQGLQVLLSSCNQVLSNILQHALSLSPSPATHLALGVLPRCTLHTPTEHSMVWGAS